MDRPSIPSNIKRQLRQEAGYGCCFCGFPFYDIHHINPWARKNDHDPDDLMLVCPNHHRACRAAISEEEQRAAKNNPINIQNGIVNGKLFVGQRELLVDLGSTLISNTKTIFSDSRSNDIFMSLRINSLGILSFSMVLLDKNGRQIGSIVDNEWSVLVDEAWDLEATEQYVTCRLARGDIALRIDARKFPVKLTGSWNFNGNPVEVTPNKIRIGTNTFSGGRMSGGRSAFGI